MSHESPTEPVEYQNEKIHAKKIEKPACRIELHVTTSPDLTPIAKREAVKIVRKEVSLPGFRKGKAPEELIQKQYRPQVEKELHTTLANLAFKETQQLAKIPVLNNGDSPVVFDMKKLSQDGAEFVFSFETEPHIPSVDPKKFILSPLPHQEVEEKHIEEALHQMRFYFAEWIPVTERPIQNGDYIIINLETVAEDGSSEQVFHETRFQVSTERMAQWMQKLVIGAKSGDVLEGVSEPDDTATEEEKREFQPKTVRIAIVKVEEAVLPELDDSFAQKVGSKDTAHLRTYITQHLQNTINEKEDQQKREQVNQFLLTEYRFDLPQSLLRDEVEHRRKQLFANPEFARHWENKTEDEKKQSEETLTTEAKNALYLFYLSRQIVNDAHIDITHQEIHNEALSLAQARHIPADQISKDLYALAFSKLMLAKAQDFLLKEQNT